MSGATPFAEASRFAWGNIFLTSAIKSMALSGSSSRSIQISLPPTFMACSTALVPFTRPTVARYLSPGSALIIFSRTSCLDSPPSQTNKVGMLTVDKPLHCQCHVDSLHRLSRCQVVIESEAHKSAISFQHTFPHLFYRHASHLQVFVHTQKL